jgi:hypothetical protein
MRNMYATDFPDGDQQLIQNPVRWCSTPVHDVATFRDEVCSNALPGRLLRSVQMAT